MFHFDSFSKRVSIIFFSIDRLLFINKDDI